MSILSKIRKKRASLYTDFDVMFEPNPITGDLVLNSDERAVRQSMKMLVLTNLGERLFQPEIGGDMINNLFRLMTPASLLVIKERVKEILDNHEPRAEIIDVDVVGLENEVKVDIFFNIRNVEEVLSTTIFIERDR